MPNILRQPGVKVLRQPGDEQQEALLSNPCERVDVVVVHFDVDVVDSAEFPLANYPHYAGLAAVEAWEVLGVVLGDEMVKAVVVTEVNPGNDPEGWMVGELVEAIGKGLERRLSLR